VRTNKDLQAAVPEILLDRDHPRIGCPLPPEIWNDSMDFFWSHAGGSVPAAEDTRSCFVSKVDIQQLGCLLPGLNADRGTDMDSYCFGLGSF
jgi:hypothetical protein